MGCCCSSAKTTPINSRDNDIKSSVRSNQGSIKGSVNGSINVAEYRRKVSMRLVQHNTVGVSPQVKHRSIKELKEINENLKD